MDKLIKPTAFKAWMLFDRLGTYQSTVFADREEALIERDSQKYLIDAKWSIVRVEVKPCRR